MRKRKQKLAIGRDAIGDTAAPSTAGTTMSARDATRHLLLSTLGKDAEPFLKLGDEISTVLNPMGGVERALVRQYINYTFKVLVLEVIEYGLLCEDDISIEKSFVRHADVLLKLSRYRASIENSAHKVLRDLRWLQAERSGIRSNFKYHRAVENAERQREIMFDLARRFATKPTASPQPRSPASKGTHTAPREISEELQRLENIFPKVEQ
jgi:hypothetical protein